MEQVGELSTRMKGSKPVKDRFLGDGVSQEDDEDEESLDSKEVLVCLCWEGRLGNAT